MGRNWVCRVRGEEQTQGNTDETDSAVLYNPTHKHAALNYGTYSQVSAFRTAA